MNALSWATYLPHALLVLALVGVVRWVLGIHRRVDNHAERIAHLEGQLDQGREITMTDTRPDPAGQAPETQPDPPTEEQNRDYPNGDDTTEADPTEAVG